MMTIMEDRNGIIRPDIILVINGTGGRGDGTGVGIIGDIGGIEWILVNFFPAFKEDVVTVSELEPDNYVRMKPAFFTACYV